MMRSCPPVFKLFIVAIIICALAILAPALWVFDWDRIPDLVLFLTLGALAGSKCTRLPQGKGSERYSKLPIGFPVTYSAILTFGPTGGALVGLANGLSTCIYPARQSVYQAAFNLVNSSLSAYVCGLVFLGIGGKTGQLSYSSPLPVAVSTAVYFFFSTLFLATAVALSACSHVPRIWRIWRDGFPWSAPGLILGTILAAFATAVYQALGSDTALLSIPVLALIYSSYKSHTDKTERSMQHIGRLQDGHEQLAAMYRTTIESLAAAIDAKDTYARQHIAKVQTVATKIAATLGMPDRDIEGITTAALLHDIGKLGVPEHVLLKSGRLSPEDYAKIQRHAAIGAKILDPVRFPWPIAAIVRSHHEKWDGSGYPDGLKGEQIPIGARILAIADVYAALTSRRSYREGWSHCRAVEHIQQLAGVHFDPIVVDAFVRAADEIRDIFQNCPNDALSQEIIDSPIEPALKHDAAEDIATANREMMALFEIGQTLSSTLNLQEVLILLANRIRNMVRCATCVIFLKDSGCPREMKAEVAVGAADELLVGWRAEVGKGLTGKVAESAEGWFGPYDPSDIAPNAPDAKLIEFRSALIVPLWGEDEVLGTINLYDQAEDHFTQDDLDILSVVARHSGVAVHNARLFENARELAIRDPLTGLHNARFLFTCLEQEISRASRYGHPLAILVMDLDNFKSVNDNFGHQRGDDVLKDVADILTAQVREYDAVVRYSGDEFMIILPETAAGEAEKTAARIRDAVAKYARRISYSRLAPLGISIGLATFPNDADNLKTLLVRADAAMYADKRRRKESAVAA